MDAYYVVNVTFMFLNISGWMPSVLKPEEVDGVLQSKGYRYHGL